MRCLITILVFLLSAPVVLAADRPDAVSEFYAGHASLQQGDPAQAVAHFSKALEMGNLEETQVAYVHHYRAIGYQRLDRHQEAIDDYTQALAMGTLPKRVQAAIYYNRAIALDHLANFERAIKDYSQAIALKPDYAEAYMNRGNAYRKLSDNDNALRDYESSAAYGNPIKHLPYFGQGLALEAKGDKAGAFKAFQTALLLAPDFEQARLKVEGYQAAGLRPTIASGTTGAATPKPSQQSSAGATATSSIPTAAKPEKANTVTPPVRTPATPPPVADAAIPATGHTSPAPAMTASSQAPSAVGAPKPMTSGGSTSATPRPVAAAASPAGVSPEHAASAPNTVAVAAASAPAPTSVPAQQPAAHEPVTEASAATTPSTHAMPATDALSAETIEGAAVPAKEAEPVRQASLGTGRFLVQVGAFTTEDIASSQAAQILGKYQDLLTGLEQDIQRADLGAKGIYFRLRFGPFSSRGEAMDRCSQLKSRGQDCIIVAGSAG